MSHRYEIGQSVVFNGHAGGNGPDSGEEGYLIDIGEFANYSNYGVYFPTLEERGGGNNLQGRIAGLGGWWCRDDELEPMVVERIEADRGERRALEPMLGDFHEAVDQESAQDHTAAPSSEHPDDDERLYERIEKRASEITAAAPLPGDVVYYPDEEAEYGYAKGILTSINGSTSGYAINAIDGRPERWNLSISEYKTGREINRPLSEVVREGTTVDKIIQIGVGGIYLAMSELNRKLVTGKIDELIFKTGYNPDMSSHTLDTRRDRERYYNNIEHHAKRRERPSDYEKFFDEMPFEKSAFERNAREFAISHGLEYKTPTYSD